MKPKAPNQRFTPSAEMIDGSLHLRGWWIFEDAQGERGIADTILTPRAGGAISICGYSQPEILSYGATIDASEEKRLPARADFVLKM